MARCVYGPDDTGPKYGSALKILAYTLCNPRSVSAPAAATDTLKTDDFTRSNVRFTRKPSEDAHTGHHASTPATQKSAGHKQ